MQRPHGHIHSDDLGELPVLEQRTDQLPLSAAQIKHPRRLGRAQLRQDRLPPLYGERYRFLLGVHLLVHRVVDVLGVRVVRLGQPLQLQSFHGPARQCRAPRQIAADDHPLLRVVLQPALAGPQQLVDLIGRYPVVLGVVQHRQQHIQLPQRLGEPALPLQHQPYVTRIAPLRERRIQRHRLGLHRPAQRLEQLLHELRAAPRGQHRHLDPQRHRLSWQLRTRSALPLHRAGEDGAQRHGQQRGRRVRTVVDVLPECRIRSATTALALPATDQGDRIDLQQQRRRAPLRVGLRVEDIRGSVRRRELLGVVGMLVQQVSEIGRGTVGTAGGGYRQEHAIEYRVPRSAAPPVFRWRPPPGTPGGRSQPSCDCTCEEISSR